jgi:hypothetical protein
MDRIEQMAFEMFADAYPIEAADADWPAFVAYAQRKNPEITEAALAELTAKYRAMERNNVQTQS